MYVVINRSDLSISAFAEERDSIHTAASKSVTGVFMKIFNNKIFAIYNPSGGGSTISMIAEMNFNLTYTSPSCGEQPAARTMPTSISDTIAITTPAPTVLMAAATLTSNDVTHPWVDLTSPVYKVGSKHAPDESGYSCVPAPIPGSLTLPTFNTSYLVT